MWPRSKTEPLVCLARYLMWSTCDTFSVQTNTTWMSSLLTASATEICFTPCWVSRLLLSTQTSVRMMKIIVKTLSPNMIIQTGWCKPKGVTFWLKTNDTLEPQSHTVFLYLHYADRSSVAGLMQYCVLGLSWCVNYRNGDVQSVGGLRSDPTAAVYESSSQITSWLRVTTSRPVSGWCCI